MRSMKIVYIYPQFARTAGTERILIDKMNWFANKDSYDILMITMEQGLHPFAFPISSKIHHIDLDVRYCDLYKTNRFFRLLKIGYFNYKFQKRFNTIIHDFKPDIVITTTYNTNILSVINRCPVTFKKVLESHISKNFLHNNNPEIHKNLLKWFHAFLWMKKVEKYAKKFDILVALNQIDADLWSPFVKTKVITNMVHLNPTDRHASLDEKHAIFVGRLSHQKGIIDLLRVWKLVHTKHPDWHLDMFGTGDLYDFILSEIKHHQTNIHVHGSTTRIFEKYLNSSMLLLTSVYEPFGLVIVEAMSCGLPVVAYDCPYGPAQIISDGLDGFLINNRSIEAMADKICTLINSPQLRYAMGQRALISSRRFSPSTTMPKWELLFQNL